MDIRMVANTALSEVPVNLMPLISDSDFKTRMTAIAYNAAGMDLVWNFVTTGGAMTQTAVTPTTGGSYDWAHQGKGMYSIEIPATGGASINNNATGYGWFSGVMDGVLPFRGPVIEFTSSNIANVLTNASEVMWANVTQWAFQNVATVDSNGYPKVTIKSGTGAGELSLASGVVDADLRQILGNAVDDTGAGADFGDNLAGNFSILFGSTRNDGVSSAGVADIGTIKTRTNRIPDVAAGSANGLMIAGSNAATSFATLSINGVSNIAQTGDSFARLGAPAGASVSADIAAISAGGGETKEAIRAEMDTNSTKLASILDYVSVTGVIIAAGQYVESSEETTENLAIAVREEVDANSTQLLAITDKLPTAAAKIAGEGATAKNLDQVAGELPLSAQGLENFGVFFNNDEDASTKTIADLTTPKIVQIGISPD